MPDKLVVSMEEKTVQREVEAYFVLKHNHSENVLQSMFENMSRSGTSTKVCFALFLPPSCAASSPGEGWKHKRETPHFPFPLAFPSVSGAVPALA